MKDLSVILERLAELIENKMAVSKALKQVAEEIQILERYCDKNRLNPTKITTRNLMNGHLK